MIVYILGYTVLKNFTYGISPPLKKFFFSAMPLCNLIGNCFWPKVIFGDKIVVGSSNLSA